MPVRPDGYISLPRLLEVRAAGKTPGDLARELMERYGQDLRDPQIAVIVRTFSAHRVHVGGRVKRPGVFPLRQPLTVLEAIFEAGGTDPQAWMAQVLVIRRKPQGSYGILAVNLKKALSGEDMGQNLQLLPFDAVYVPDSPIAEVNTFVDLYIRKNIPVDFGIRYAVEL